MTLFIIYDEMIRGKMEIKRGQKSKQARKRAIGRKRKKKK